MRLA
jgi:hypothetical protein